MNPESPNNPTSTPPPETPQPVIDAPTLANMGADKPNPTPDTIGVSNVSNIHEQIGKNKKQARLLLILTALFGILFITGIIVLVNVTRTDSPNKNGVTIDEQLKIDANSLGLGIINFRNGSNYFEITPQKVTRLEIGYIPKTFNDPRTYQPYVLTTAIPKIGELQYIVGGACNTDDSIRQTSDNKNFAIRVRLENDTLFCLGQSDIVQVPDLPSTN